MIYKKASFEDNDNILEIYKKHYDANKTFKDIEYDAEEEIADKAFLGALGGFGAGALAGHMLSKPLNKVKATLIGGTVGANLGAFTGYLKGKIDKRDRIDTMLRDRETALQALDKQAEDTKDVLKKNLEYQKAKDLAAFDGIRHLDPADEADYTVLRDNFRDGDRARGESIQEGVKNKYSILGGALGGLSGITAVAALAKRPSKWFDEKAIASGLAGAGAGYLAGLIMAPDNKYTHTEAVERSARERKAFRDALKEKYDVD